MCRFRAASPHGPCGIDSGIWGFAFEKAFKGVTAPALKRGGGAGCCASWGTALCLGKGWGGGTLDQASFKK